jgi:hypothetical protein
MCRWQGADVTSSGQAGTPSEKLVELLLEAADLARNRVLVTPELLVHRLLLFV